MSVSSLVCCWSIFSAMIASLALREYVWSKVEVVVLHVLLGDRRAAAGVVAAHLAPHRPGDAHRRDAAVLVEGAVLGGDDRVLDVLRDLVARHDGAVLRGEPAHLVLAAAVVDDRGLVVGEVVRLRDVDQPVRDVEADQAERHQAEERPEDDLPGRQPAEPAAAPAGLPALPGGGPGRGGAAALTGAAALAGARPRERLRGRLRGGCRRRRGASPARGGGRGRAGGCRCCGRPRSGSPGRRRAGRRRRACATGQYEGPSWGRPAERPSGWTNLHRTSPVFPRMEPRHPRRTRGPRADPEVTR